MDLLHIKKGMLLLGPSGTVYEVLEKTKNSALLKSDYMHQVGRERTPSETIMIDNVAALKFKEIFNV